jgi:hypothetical protein
LGFLHLYNNFENSSPVGKTKMSIFHYAFKVKDIAEARKFYVEILACKEGRSTETWIDFDFFGNQISAHLSKDFPKLDYCGKVDDVSVPIPHFGCVLDINDFKTIQKKLESEKIEFVIKPQKRYENKTAEQWTMFVFDFSGNALEFKSFTKSEDIFTP